MKKGVLNNKYTPKRTNDTTVIETFCIQTYALMHKNLILQRRNIGASLTVYFAGFFFFIWYLALFIPNK